MSDAFGQFSQPGPTPHAHDPSADPSARQMAALAHLSSFAGAIILIAPLGPLLVWILKKDGNEFVARESAEALNFSISWWLYGWVLALVTVVLMPVLIGFALIPIGLVGCLIWAGLVIAGALTARDGGNFRYPLTVRFIR